MFLQIEAYPAVFAFFNNFTAENVIETEVAKYFASMLWNWKFNQKHFLMKYCKFDLPQ